MKDLFGVNRFLSHARFAWRSFWVSLLLLLAVGLAGPASAVTGTALPTVRIVDGGPYEGHPDDPPHSYWNSPGRVTYSTVQQTEGHQAEWLNLFSTIRALFTLTTWGAR
jgi:hypothetical protein